MQITITAYLLVSHAEREAINKAILQYVSIANKNKSCNQYYPYETTATLRNLLKIAEAIEGKDCVCVLSLDEDSINALKVIRKVYYDVPSDNTRDAEVDADEADSVLHALYMILERMLLPHLYHICRSRPIIHRHNE